MEKALTELEVGEALISFLDENGTPSMVERAKIRPPESKMGTVDESYYQQLISQSPYDRIYRDAVDRESAFELLSAKLLIEKEAAEAENIRKEAEKLAKEKAKEDDKVAKELAKKEREEEKKRKNNPLTKFTSTFMSQLFRSASREIIRGAMGVFKKR